MPHIAILRPDRLRHYCNDHGFNVTTFARRIGLNPSSVYRNMRSETTPSNTFIAGCVAVFGAEAFTELFHIADEHDARTHPRRSTFAPVLCHRSTRNEPPT